MKRLTVIQNEKAKNETEKLGFVATEHDNMQEFFNNEIKRNDAKHVMRTIQKLFKDIRNPKLKKYFIEALTKHVRYFEFSHFRKKALDFMYLSNVVFIICKETDVYKKLEFLFDLFSNHTESIKRYTILIM
jgi:hypothetical protein